ncbi:hypothetical protein [Nocardioides donggukensis]|uniref:DUF2613 family protein n=1 Tax=Nocardioides donggukensis TaxID=2774019 RepID=A0A927Q2I0_9ACTN|nr:hypothetical protein [Nocardioides donggukensis]MBD8869686.1 hypothetical protein [Nocardioides donggukensis]
MGSIAGIAASIVLGTAVAVGTVVGLVSNQTGAPSQSPANAESPVVNYGTD